MHLQERRLPIMSNDEMNSTIADSNETIQNDFSANDSSVNDSVNNDSTVNEVETNFHTDRSVNTSEPYQYKTETNYYSSYAYQQASESNTTEHSNARMEHTATAEYPTPKKKRPFLKLVRFVAAAACFGLIAGSAFFGVNYVINEYLIPSDEVQESSNNSENQNNNSQSYASDSQTVLSNSGLSNVTISSTLQNAIDEEGIEDNVVVNVVEENMAATVAISSTVTSTVYYFGQTYSEDSVNGGSGIIVGVNDTDLLIATNNHVVEGAKSIDVTFNDGTVIAASVRGTDSTADLAILSVPLSEFTEETFSQIRIATLGDSDTVKVGEMAIAIGNALGYGQSVTVGYISAKNREVTVDGNTMVLLQTDAAINGGNSGGPLFNTKGEVIGINSVKYSDTSVEGMCFAIPISRAIPILNELMNREVLTEEEQGYLGIVTKTITDDIASFYGWPTGVYVYSLSEGSAAEQAGIFTGDIITSINGVQVVTKEQLKSAVNSYRYGTTIEIVLQRNVNGTFEEITLSVTLMQNPNLSESTEATVPASDNQTNENKTPGRR